MTLKNIDFFDSPVMRELVRNSIKNGTISQPTLGEIVKEASEKKISTSTGDVLSDVANLADGLRKKGFVAEAKSIEEKLVNFKCAEKAAFDAILDQAHPDGDAHMADAKDGLGDVETEVSAHEKIMDVISKQPTGKQASLIDSVLKSVAFTLKVADDNEDNKFHELLSNLKSELFKLASLIVVGGGAGAGFPAYNALNSYLLNPPSLGLTDDSKRAVLNDFKNRFSVLHNLLEGSSEREGIQSLPGKNEEFNAILNNVLGIVNKVINFVSQLIGEKSEGELHNKVEYEVLTKEQVQSAAAPFNAAIKYLDQWKQVASPADRKLADQYITIASKYSSTISYVASMGEVRFGKLYSALVAQDSKNAQFNTFAALKQAANSFLSSIKSLILKKMANDDSDDLIKESQLSSFPGFTLKQPTAPAVAAPVQDELQQKLDAAKAKLPAGTTNSPTIPGAPGGIIPVSAPAHSSGGSRAPIDPNEKDHVQAMQFALLRLAAFVQGKDPGAVSVLLNVGKGSNKADMDGVWGPNTSKAVTKAKEILDKWNAANKDSAVLADIVQSQMHQKNTIEDADKNTSVIVNFLSHVGVDTTGLGGGKTQSSMYDKLAKNMQFSEVELRSSPANGMYPITTETLGSLASLYNFVVGKLGVEPQTMESNDPTQMGSRGFTVAKWDEILKWFMTRAKYLNSLAKDNAGRQNASNYHGDVVRLWNQLIAYGKQAGLTFPNDMNRIVPEGELPSGFSGTNEKGNPSGSGKEYNSKNHGPYSGAAYDPKSEGFDQAEAPEADPNLPPFGSEIDLSNQWFRRVAQSFPEAKGIGLLPFNDFWNWGAREFVNNFTTTRGPHNVNNAIEQALEHLGVVKGVKNDNYYVDPNTGNIFIMADGKPVPAMNYPQIQQSVARVMNVNPKQKAMEFLSYLGKAVNDAKADWMSRANPSRKEKINIYRWQQKWQEAIANKLEEIRNI